MYYAVSGFSCTIVTYGTNLVKLGILNTDVNLLDVLLWYRILLLVLRYILTW